MGTGNDLARTLGLSFDPVRAATAIARGTVRAIDLGVATGAECRRLFTNACIGGFPVAVNQAIDPDTKRRLGPAAFLVGGAKAATELDRSLVRIDDVEVPDCVAAGVGNGRTAGGGIEVWPSAVPDDGVLNGCALGAPGRAAALKLAGLMRHGAHERLEHVATSAGPRITLHSDPPIEVNCDGELIGLRTPATFEIAGRLRVRT
jgi:diacylglycerol kinase (ATP)